MKAALEHRGKVLHRTLLKVSPLPLLKFVAGGIFVVSGLGACHPAEKTAGGSEIGNPVITGTAYSSTTSRPAENALVRLRPSGYLKSPTGDSPDLRDSLQEVHTDAEGVYHFPGVPPGSYTIEVNDLNGNAYALKIVVPQTKDTVLLDPVGLLPTGGIEGQVLLEKTNDEPQIYVQIYGLEKTSAVDMSSGAYTLSDIPWGFHSLRYVSESPGKNRDSVAVSVLPNASTRSDTIRFSDYYGAWSNRRNIYILPTNEGLTLTESVTQFPLLVRLDSTTWDFALPSADIRFTNSQSKPLAYEIDHWDASSQTAGIWVQVDTLWSGPDSQYLTMHWGNPQAFDDSHGPAVFTRDQNFAGVWHLGETVSADSADDVYHSAATDENTGNHRITNGDKSGVIGPGQSFTSGDYIEVSDAHPNFRPDSSLSLSVWFRAVDLDTFGGTILTAGDNYGLRFGEVGEFPYRYLTFWVYENQGNTGFKDHRIDADGLVDSAWHQAFVNFTNDGVQIYIDGALAGEFNERSRIDYSLWNNILMGRHIWERPGFNFTGSLDEVRVANQTRSSQWIALEYANQRQGSLLLQFD